eukprot:239480_1
MIKNTNNGRNDGMDTTLISTKADNDSNKMDELNESNIFGLTGSIMFIIIIMLIILLCIICGIFILIYLRKTKQLKSVKEKLNVLINDNTVRLKHGNNSKEKQQQQKQDRVRGKSYNKNINLTNDQHNFNRVVSQTFSAEYINHINNGDNIEIMDNIEMHIVSPSINTPHDPEYIDSEIFNNNDYNDMYGHNNKSLGATPMGFGSNIDTNHGNNTDEGTETDDEYNEFEGNNINKNIRKHTGNDSDDDIWKNTNDLTNANIDTTQYQSD